ncbi:potassium transporter Trk [Bifidobacterium margollesii]|uniref:Potassium transporter Trk n=1 Tax=Bifidobacterium margollesii TaxID=2020964 RepID=A0A2N5J8N7_9BIFI|nr:potassium transporter TrkG [Bifidobacterium margollesii]PLS30555.1 potassium transporter Trk [Bifidobacterium margollesii]
MRPDASDPDGRRVGRGARRTARTDRALSHPGRLTVTYFLILAIIVTLLLLIPEASREHGSTNLPIAAFTAISALTTCGIPVVNMSQHWTLFGQIIILIAMQLGGLGVMTLASAITISISKRLSAPQNILTAAELGTTKLSEVKGLLRIVVVSTFVIEAVTFTALLPRILEVNHGAIIHSLWESLFFAVSAYNNTGFTPDSAGVYVNDWRVGLPIMLSTSIGTLGFPVLLNIYQEFRRRRGPHHWSLHIKLTLVTMLVVILSAMAWFLLVEWNNTAIYRDDSVAHRLRDALTIAVMPRTTGFDASWMPNVSEATKGFMAMVMFVGGGSASTAGGIHVTTLAVLFLVCRSVMGNKSQITAFHRRLHTATVRMSMAIASSSFVLVYGCALLLGVVTGRPLADTLFETCSAFSLGGATLSVASESNPASLMILAVVMVVGRIGPIIIGYSAVRPRPPEPLRWPSENIVVG